MIMKFKDRFALLLLATLFTNPILAFGQDTINATEDTAEIYKDGTYMGQSRASYTAEPYWGKVRITIENGLFTDINFMIRDSALHETFNDKYASHFAGNEIYIQQTRNDWNGVKTYPLNLKSKQKISKVDVISGATWSYNIFKASLQDALKDIK